MTREVSLYPAEPVEDLLAAERLQEAGLGLLASQRRNIAQLSLLVNGYSPQQITELSLNVTKMADQAEELAGLEVLQESTNL